MTTALDDDELLTEVRLPLLPADTRFGFQEFSRRAGDFALGMALVTYRLEDGKIADAARRHRRRRAVSAPDRGGGSRAERQVARAGGVPGRRRSGRRGDRPA